MATVSTQYVQKVNGTVICTGDRVRIHGERTAVVTGFEREHPNQHGHEGQWLALLEWGIGGAATVTSSWRVESVTLDTPSTLGYRSISPALTYVRDQAVLIAAADPEAPRSPSRSGHGGKIPTRWRVKLIDNRWRRVYAMAYGNAASCYLLVRGEVMHLDTGLERMLQDL